MVIRRRRTTYQAAVSERVEDDVFRSPKAHEIRRQSACVTSALRTTHSTWLYFYREIQPGGMRCPQRAGYTCALSPDFMRLRRTEHVVFNAFANCRLICRAPSANHHRLDDKPIHLFAALGPLHAYLEKEEARIFGELPLQFSNDAPALI